MPHTSKDEKLKCLSDRGVEIVKLEDIEGLEVLDVGVGDGYILY